MSGAFIKIGSIQFPNPPMRAGMIIKKKNYEKSMVCNNCIIKIVSQIMMIPRNSW